ncbi:hypothetical protein BC629DRAFT_895635 [Irpex lacteus]|nr:hypothetical protein BC629DRAFT_895635 [Irpex lacteus]
MVKRSLQYQRTRTLGQHNKHLALRSAFQRTRSTSLTSAIDAKVVPFLTYMERDVDLKNNERGTRMVINAPMHTGIFNDLNIAILDMKDDGVDIPSFGPSCPMYGSSDFLGIQFDASQATPGGDIDEFLKSKDLKSLRPFKNICVLEAKPWTGQDASEAYLDRHFPEIVCKMLSLALHLERDRIRGVLSTGYSWMFLALEREAGKPGGTYVKSSPLQMDFSLHSDVEAKDGKYPPALIYNILHDWIANSSEDIRGNKWFHL